MKNFYSYSILTLFLMISGISFSQNFRVISFEEDMSDLSAISQARTDVNDDKCAIIKVYTNLDKLYFETRLGIEGDIVKKTGELWIYVSPKEKQLKIIKASYIPLEYSLPVIIEESKVYKLTLTGSGSNYQNNDSNNSLTEFVVIETEPSGAQIYINEQLKGVTPLTIPMIEGNYNCRIEMPLYKTEEFNLNVIAGNTITISKFLSELDIYGNINILTNPIATIYIDNKKVGTRAYSGRLIEGLHVIRIEAENYKTYRKDLLIVANRDYEITEKLDPKLGVISVQSEPLGASIFIDGEFVGTTPKFVRDIMCGEHSISIEKEAYSSINETIYIPYDKTKEFIYNLNNARLVTISTEPSGADIYLNNALIGKTPIEIDLDESTHNKIMISKLGYHTVYDEIPQESKLKDKTFQLEKLGLAQVFDKNAVEGKDKPKNQKERDYRKERTIIGWSISGLAGRPGGMSTNIYGNFGNNSQYGIFIEGGYQFNNYDNSHIDGVVNFPRISFGASYNAWIGDYAVLEAYGAYGLEYATGLNWKNYTIWDYTPDNVHTKHLRVGVRAGVRISPHAELFAAYNVNYTDGPALDVYGTPVEINGITYNYQTIFPDRETPNWEIGIRFVAF